MTLPIAIAVLSLSLLVPVQPFPWLLLAASFVQQITSSSSPHYRLNSLSSLSFITIHPLHSLFLPAFALLHL